MRNYLVLEWREAQLKIYMKRCRKRAQGQPKKMVRLLNVICSDQMEWVDPACKGGSENKYQMIFWAVKQRETLLKDSHCSLEKWSITIVING